jgi:tetratricopeptide (TPR) repeat protein
MRWLLLLLAFAAFPARGEVRSAEDCATAVAADPARAREEAAVWQRLGGGVPARLCEADALAALGAHATAAALLTRLAENPNRAIGAELRAVILADGAVQWLAAGRPDLARAALTQADTIAPAGPERLTLRARAEAGEADWLAARATLEAVLAAAPDDALAHALLAATLRQQGDPAAALTEAETALRLAPGLPEALFETAAARAETGDAAGASRLWLELIRFHPDSDLAAPSRANLQRLN